MTNAVDAQKVDLKPVPPAVPAPGPLLPHLRRQTSEQQVSDEVETPKGTDQVEPGTLIIGSGISFAGEITACNRLVVEGVVEASLPHCREVLITGTGCFKGDARAEDAEVSGRVDGNLMVRKRLLIRAGGQVSGSTTYGQIEIERGGRIKGHTEARDGVEEW